MGPMLARWTLLSGTVLYDMALHCTVMYIVGSLSHILYHRWKTFTILTLSMQGPSFLDLTGSISWFLMPWLIVLPIHQQPWYWLGKLGTVYPKKYAHGFCFAVLCCGYTLTDFPISIRLTSLALWQSNDCPSASKATLMNMDKYFMWIHYERLHNHNKAKHNKTVCIFLGIYCRSVSYMRKDFNYISHVNVKEW